MKTQRMWNDQNAVDEWQKSGLFLSRYWKRPAFWKIRKQNHSTFRFFYMNSASYTTRYGQIACSKLWFLQIALPKIRFYCRNWNLCLKKIGKKQFFSLNSIFEQFLSIFCCNYNSLTFSLFFGRPKKYHHAIRPVNISRRNILRKEKFNQHVDFCLRSFANWMLFSQK